MNYRLQFAHHSETFSTRDEALKYISGIYNPSLAAKTTDALFAEPFAVQYLDAEGKPQVIVAIGKSDNGATSDSAELYHVIDSAHIDEEIKELGESAGSIKEIIETIQKELAALSDNVDAFSASTEEKFKVTDEAIEDVKDDVKALSEKALFNIKVNGVEAEAKDNIAEATIDGTEIQLDKAVGHTKDMTLPDGEIICHDTTLTSAVTEIVTNLNALDQAIEDVDQDLRETIDEEIKGLTIVKETEGLEAEVKERYTLKDVDGFTHGEPIKIYKDSAIKTAQTGHVGAIVDKETGEITDGPSNKDEALLIVYERANGEYDLITIDLEDFVLEAEFKDGLSVESHEVRVKIDGDSESFLSVSEKGVKVAGVEEAIANKVNKSAEDLTSGYTEKIQTLSDKTDESFAKKDGEIKTLTEKDTELDGKIEAEAVARKAVTGVDADEYKPHDKQSEAMTVITNAKSLDEADMLLDKAVAAAQDDVDALSKKVNDHVTEETENINTINSNIKKVAESVGLNPDDYSYAPSSNVHYITWASTVSDAVESLDSALYTEEEGRKAVGNKVDALSSATEVGFADIEKAIEGLSVTAKGDDYIKAEATGKAIAVSANTVKVENANEDHNGLAAALDVKTYVDGKDSAIAERVAVLENKTIEGDSVVVVSDTETGKKVALKIADDDKVLSQNASGLSATLSFEYKKEENKIILKGHGDNEIGSVDTTDFVKDGMLDDVRLDTTTDPNDPKLIFIFNTEAGKKDITLSVKGLVDIYTIAEGSQKYLGIKDKEISAKVNVADGLASYNDLKSLQEEVSKLNGNYDEKESYRHTLTDVLGNTQGSAEAAAEGTVLNYYYSEDDKERHYYVPKSAGGGVSQEDFDKLKNEVASANTKLATLEESLNTLSGAVTSFMSEFDSKVENLINAAYLNNLLSGTAKEIAVKVQSVGEGDAASNKVVIGFAADTIFGDTTP